MGSRVDEKPTVYNTLAQNHNFLKCASACIVCAQDCECIHMCVVCVCVCVRVCGGCACVVCECVYRVPEVCSELQQSILKVTVYINMLISTTNY